MQFIRFQTTDQPPSWGWIHDDRVGLVEGDLFTEYRRMDAHIPLSRAEMLPPVVPGKILCVGRNYAAHAQEHGADTPEIPLIFLKPSTSLLAPSRPIVLPRQSSRVEHEAELAVVIGRRGRHIQADEAVDYIFGYTIANDVTARDIQRSESQWARAKGFDTFCPIGPWVETDFDPADALISCHVNGDMRQMASTRDMVFTVRQIIAFISAAMTLEPGDVILTGTPAGVGPLQDGDVVEVTIDGLGKLRNPVVSSEAG